MARRRGTAPASWPSSWPVHGRSLRNEQRRIASLCFASRLGFKAMPGAPAGKILSPESRPRPRGGPFGLRQGIESPGLWLNPGKPPHPAGPGEARPPCRRPRLSGGNPAPVIRRNRLASGLQSAGRPASAHSSPEARGRLCPASPPRRIRVPGRPRSRPAWGIFPCVARIGAAGGRITLAEGAAAPRNGIAAGVPAGAAECRHSLSSPLIQKQKNASAERRPAAARGRFFCCASAAKHIEAPKRAPFPGMPPG